MRIDLRSVDDGVALRLKVMPGSRQDSFRGVHDGALKISVMSAPEKGKANKAVILLLAKTLGISKNQLEIQTGLTDSRKTILVRGMTVPHLLEKLASAGVLNSEEP